LPQAAWASAPGPRSTTATFHLPARWPLLLYPDHHRHLHEPPPQHLHLPSTHPAILLCRALRITCARRPPQLPGRRLQAHRLPCVHKHPVRIPHCDQRQLVLQAMGGRANCPTPHLYPKRYCARRRMTKRAATNVGSPAFTLMRPVRHRGDLRIPRILNDSTIHHTTKILNLTHTTPAVAVQHSMPLRSHHVLILTPYNRTLNRIPYFIRTFPFLYLSYKTQKALVPPHRPII